MGLTYFDAATGRKRIKRRYVWGAWGFVLGFFASAGAHALLYSLY